MKDLISKYLNITPLQDDEWDAFIELYREILQVKGRGSQKGNLNSHYGKHHTKETKLILSEFAKERKVHGMQGKKHSEETKKIISEKSKGRTSPMKGVTPWNKGVKMQTETKEKIRQKKIGKPLSLETKNKLSESSKNRKRKICENCEKQFDASNYARWHGIRCKYGKTL